MPGTPQRLMLIEPPFYRLYKDSFSLIKFPLGLGYLAAVALRDTDWKIQAYNADFNPRSSEPVTLEHMAGQGYDSYLANLRDSAMPIWREVKSAIEDFMPSVVGISAKTQNYASASLVASIVKQIDPSILVVVGGPHPSMAGEKALDCPHFDVAAAGEGEETLVEILKALESGENLGVVRGIYFRKDGVICQTPPRLNLPDLDRLPHPHTAAPLALKDYSSYPLGAFKFVFATRGCPYGCEFCGSRNIWSRKVRYRSARNVVDEIKGLMRLGLSSVHFDDDTFGIAKKYIAELCGLLAAECPGLAWSCETTVNIIDEETVGLMKRAGCQSIQIGVESGNNEMLKKIQKNITIEKAMEAAALIRRHGIAVQTFFMAGFPEETEETLADTWRAITSIQTDEILFSVFTPYPGTDTFAWCKERGLVSDDYDVSLYNHQSPENCFTAFIPRERFRHLIGAMMVDIDRLNKSKRLRRQWRERLVRARNSLEHDGFAATFARTVRFVRRRLWA
jgi:anaerobic magnesium-protoporphyrin IX monomethyl ester cyclase